jgi:putative ABC transport system ATP-binding protein
MIRCQDVHKSYRLSGREVPALRGVSLAIDAPGFYAIMGRSGSGKSTLLHLLATLDRPDAGTIEIGGRRVDNLSEREATHFRRRGLGIVFQHFNLIPTLTAAENVELPGLLAGDEPRTLRARAMELLATLDLDDRAGHRPEAMSGGEQQRVAIARALLYAPPVLLADEPTGNLDSDNAERLWALLGSLAASNGITVLMVTHEPAAAAHCRRAFLLRDGTVHGQMETEGLDAAGVAARYQQALGTA